MNGEKGPWLPAKRELFLEENWLHTASRAGKNALLRFSSYAQFRGFFLAETNGYLLSPTGAPAAGQKARKPRGADEGFIRNSKWLPTFPKAVGHGG